jgi:hypothetical protein
MHYILSARPLAACSGLQYSEVISVILGMSSTSFLFLQRARALYADNRVVRWTFSFLWLAECAVMATLGITATTFTHVPGTQYCTSSSVERPLAAGGFVWLFFDTCVFLAISYRIASSPHFVIDADARLSWGTLISGKALPSLSRAVLQGGQQYYL